MFCFLSFPACSDTTKLVTKMNASLCSTPVEKPEWMDKTFKQVEAKLGSASSKETFNMKDGPITEFRGKLEVLFPRSNPESQSIQINEASWMEGECVLTLWFRKMKDNWVVVDTLYWHKDSDF